MKDFNNITSEKYANSKNNIKNKNWFDISKTPGLSLDFMRKYKNELDWTYISRYQILSEWFIDSFQDRINWNCISSNQELIEWFIHRHRNDVNWHYISQYQRLSIEFIIGHTNFVNWKYITQYQQSISNLIDSFPTNDNSLLNDIKDKLDWDWISQYKILNRSFVIKYCDYLNWNKICKYQNLDDSLILSIHDKLGIYNKSILYTSGIINENFVDKYNDHIKQKWDWVSKYIQLTSHFIDKYKDRVNWMYISAEQNYDSKFIIKFSDKLHWYWVLHRKNITIDIIKKIHKKIIHVAFSHFPYLVDDIKEEEILSLNEKESENLNENDIQLIKHIITNFKTQCNRDISARITEECEYNVYSTVDDFDSSSDDCEE